MNQDEIEELEVELQPFQYIEAEEAQLFNGSDTEDEDEDLQWKNHTPGLSATTRRVTDSPTGTCTVSRRTGFGWLSFSGGLSVGSLEV